MLRTLNSSKGNFDTSHNFDPIIFKSHNMTIRNSNRQIKKLNYNPKLIQL